MSFMAGYAVQALRGRGGLFWALNSRLAGGIPGSWTRDFPAEPWIRVGSMSANEEGVADPYLLRPPGELNLYSQFAYWHGASDFQTFRHTLRFTSVPDLLRVAAGTPRMRLAAVSAAMNREWAAEHRRASCAYERIAGALLRCFDTQGRSGEECAGR